MTPTLLAPPVVEPDGHCVNLVPLAQTAGRFVPIDFTVAPLHTNLQAEMALALSVENRDISCFDGESGTGKTSAATLAAQTVGGVEWKYCMPPQGGTTKATMNALYSAVYGFHGNLPERDATDALVQRLAVGDLGVVIDEVHHVGLVGMQQFRHVWDRTAIHGHQFPMLFIGCNVRGAIRHSPEVSNRVARWVPFNKVRSDEDLEAVAATLHPRLAATSVELLHWLNQYIAEEVLRGWRNLNKNIPLLSTTKSKATPLTKADCNELRALCGM